MMLWEEVHSEFIVSGVSEGRKKEFFLWFSFLLSEVVFLLYNEFGQVVHTNEWAGREGYGIDDE